MNKQFEQVKEFHSACGIEMPKVPTALDQGPLITNSWLTGSLHCLTQEIKVLSSQQFQGEEIGGEVAKRVSWMLEELTEFACADRVEDQADALIDLIYFALGTFTLIGVKPESIFEIVHAANMAKVGSDGKVQRNEQGKIIKPEGWQAPEPLIEEEISRQLKAAR